MAKTTTTTRKECAALLGAIGGKRRWANTTKRERSSAMRKLALKRHGNA